MLSKVLRKIGDLMSENKKDNARYIFYEWGKMQIVFDLETDIEYTMTIPQ